MLLLLSVAVASADVAAATAAVVLLLLSVAVASSDVAVA